MYHNFSKETVIKRLRECICKHITYAPFIFRRNRADDLFWHRAFFSTAIVYFSTSISVLSALILRSHTKTSLSLVSHSYFPLPYPPILAISPRAQSLVPSVTPLTHLALYKQLTLRNSNCTSSSSIRIAPLYMYFSPCLPNRIHTYPSLYILVHKSMW